MVTPCGSLAQLGVAPGFLEQGQGGSHCRASCKSLHCQGCPGSSAGVNATLSCLRSIWLEFPFSWSPFVLSVAQFAEQRTENLKPIILTIREAPHRPVILAYQVPCFLCCSAPHPSHPCPTFHLPTQSYMHACAMETLPVLKRCSRICQSPRPAAFCHFIC